jgi:hypothetical protein
MIKQGIVAIGTISKGGTINKAWAAAIAAPLADWLVGILADTLWERLHLATPDSAQMALVSLIVGLVVYQVPNLAPDAADQTSASI